jgi:uncharacterized membrane protein
VVCTAPAVLTLIILLQFAACAAFILLSRSCLAGHGDRMDEQPGMELRWIGVALMASLTSISELFTVKIHLRGYRSPVVSIGSVYFTDHIGLPLL